MGVNIKKCCCTPTCDTCLGTFCANCTTGKAPNAWIITLTGFGACDGHCVAGGAGDSYKITGNPNGTYTISESPPCLWGNTITTPTPATATHWATTNCTGASATYGQLNVSMSVSASNNRRVLMQFQDVLAFSGAVLLADPGSGNVGECCTSKTWAASTDSDCNGTGGMITATPCV